MKQAAAPLAVIGGGNMGRALLAGAVAGGFLDPARVVVAEPDPEKHPNLAATGAAVVNTAGEAMSRLGELEAGAGEGAVLLAVKPQMLGVVAQELGGVVGSRVVVSVLAGVPAERVRERLGGRARVVRVMPNLPATIGLGMSAVCRRAGSGPGEEQWAIDLLRCVGEVVVIDERMMDAFTAVAGSGPAYVFYLAEAMARAAVELGFDEGEAQRMVGATLRGAAGLLLQSGGTASQLRAAVTSRGGTTAAAMDSLDRDGVMLAMVNAVGAARDRGAELAALA